MIIFEKKVTTITSRFYYLAFFKIIFKVNFHPLAYARRISTCLNHKLYIVFLHDDFLNRYFFTIAEKVYIFAKKKCENLKIRAEASALSSFKKSTAHGIDIVYKV